MNEWSVVGVRLQQTQCPLNGLGHAGWIAARWAEMQCRKFCLGTAIQRLATVSPAMCGGRAKSLIDHLVSSSFLSSVEDSDSR